MKEKWDVIDDPKHPLEEGGRWVRIIERVKLNATGEIRELETCHPFYESIEEDEPSAFYWSEGNLSCDCNRALEFKRAGGESTADDETKCSDGLYSVQLVNPVTGRVFYDEFSS